jgi:hypothetical protein
MMKKLLISAVIAAVSINAAHAYQVALSGDVGYSQTNNNINSDQTGVTAGGTYYFNNVSSNSGPLAEEAFIQRASSVSAAYNYTYAENDYTHRNIDQVGVSGQLYVPNSNFYAAAGVSHINGQGNSNNGGAYNLSVGILPINDLLLTIGLVSTYDLPNKETDPTISAKYLTKIGINDVNFEGNARFGDHDSSYGVRGDYYLDRTLSIGATYDLNKLDHSDDSYAFGLNARKFIAENISVQGGVSAGNDYNGDSNYGINVGGTYRF